VKLRALQPTTLDPVQPNIGVERWYYAQLSRELETMFADVLGDVSVAWLETPPILAGDASLSLTLRRRLGAWGVRWVKRFDRMSEDIARQFVTKSFQAAQVSMQASLKKAGFTVAFKPTTKSVEAFRAALSENVNLIRSIPQQFLKDVETHVWRGVTQGSKLGEVSRKLRESYNVSVKRAALIARDQNAKAKASIESARRLELGVTKAIWQHSHGGKEPRPSHVAMNGKVFDIAKGMWDADEGEYVWPGTLINCRCTSRAVIPGFND
jgi:SPP1 gp7 family putative phage head morphogenesis protein